MKALIFLLANLIVVLILSCNYEQTTETTKRYDLNTILSDSNWVEVTDTSSIIIDCLDGDKIAEYYLIKDTNDYRQLNDIRWQYNNCLSYVLPFIDFDKYSLLGLITRTGPCEIRKTVFMNDAEKKYFYNIEINIISKNKILITNRNWLLIPRLKVNYIVIFDTTMKFTY